MDAIRIGTCGFWDPPAGWRGEYLSKLAAFAAGFDHLEFNRPFYDLPMVSTVERWRKEIETGSGDRGFSVSMKAWQAITPPHLESALAGHRRRPDRGRAEGGGLSSAERYRPRA